MPASELRVVLTVEDFDRTVALFRDALGLEQTAAFENDGGHAVLLDAGHGTLEIFDEAQAAAIDRIEVGKRIAGRYRLAFRTADSESVSADLAAAGATIAGGPVQTPWGDRNVRVLIPDGIQLTLFTPPAVSPELKPAEPQELADTFIATWNVRDGGRRLALLRGLCLEEATFASAGGVVHGCVEMSASIGEFLRAFPGSSVLAGRAEGHHGHVRFTWRTVFGDGRADLSGDDYIELDASGKIKSVVSWDGHTTPPVPGRA